MGRPKKENPKSDFLTIRITEELRASIDAAYVGIWAKIPIQDFAAHLIELGLKKQARLAASLESELATNEDEIKTGGPDPFPANAEKLA
jgi:hypothetical protein